jgi:hypothetical protein
MAPLGGAKCLNAKTAEDNGSRNPIGHLAHQKKVGRLIVTPIGRTTQKGFVSLAIAEILEIAHLRQNRWAILGQKHADRKYGIQAPS